MSCDELCVYDMFNEAVGIIKRCATPHKDSDNSEYELCEDYWVENDIALRVEYNIENAEIWGTVTTLYYHDQRIAQSEETNHTTMFSCANKPLSEVYKRLMG